MIGGAAKESETFGHLVLMAAAETMHVVDDDPAIRDSLRLLLDASGFTVRTQDSGTAS
jgi:FixJ family two-component response regulator